MKKRTLVHGYPSAVEDYCLQHGIDPRRSRVKSWKDLRSHTPDSTRIVLVYCPPLDQGDRDKLLQYATAQGFEVVHA